MDASLMTSGAHEFTLPAPPAKMTPIPQSDPGIPGAESRIGVISQLCHRPGRTTAKPAAGRRRTSGEQ
ncbi:hypothetical protein ART_1169 [Arthrobacter sp. PAMC 25486]|nr:hypothetical protein ART_1169 [Arthrobacter sp. PAMC 25486]